MVVEDKRAEKWREDGWCRMWVEMVLRKADELDVGGGFEPREVMLAPDYWHSFVMYTDAEKYKYVLDGVGIWKFGEYFGPLEEAPEPWQNSRLDSLIENSRKRNAK